MDEDAEALRGIVERLEADPQVRSARVDVIRAALGMVEGDAPSLDSLLALGGSVDPCNNTYLCLVGLVALREGRVDVAQTIHERRLLTPNTGLRSRHPTRLTRHFEASYAKYI